MNRFKKALALLSTLVLVTLMATLSVSAASSDFVIEDGVLTGYNGPGGVVVIPDEVTTIKNGIFNGNNTITELVIGDNVTSIISSEFNTAFGSCQSLEKVTIGDGLTQLPHSIFTNCKSLTSVTLGSNIETIYQRAFCNCTSLVSITLPDSVTVIREYAFSSCTSLASITLPDAVTDIYNNAFIACTSLETIILGENVSWIRSDAFPGGVVVQVPMGSTSDASVISYATDYVGTSKEISITYPPSTWAQSSVTQAIDANLVPAALQMSYTDTITRSDFCALGVALYEEIKGSEITARTTFTDTTDENVEKMAGLGIVNGTGDGVFSPEGLLTREQAATILARLSDALGNTLTAQDATFSDNDTASSWALDSIGQMQASGIMSGTGDNNFAPQDGYTREQSIMTILRLYQAITGEDTATEPPTSVSTTATLEIYAGRTGFLPTTFSPTGTGGVDVSWTSSNEAVVTVDTTGTVTGVAPGTATITLTTSNGLSASSTVTVLAQSISLPGTLSLSTGSTSTLEPTLVPADMVYSLVETWTSSDTSVATVNADGKVTAVGPGTATITVTSSGGLTTGCVVTVTEYVPVTYAFYGPAIQSAISTLRTNLKNPTSLTIYNVRYGTIGTLIESVYGDDHYGIILIEYSATNSLGNMVYDTCVALLNVDDYTLLADVDEYVSDNTLNSSVSAAEIAFLMTLSSMYKQNPTTGTTLLTGDEMSALWTTMGQVFQIG